MALSTSEANDIAIVTEWAMGRRVTRQTACRITDGQATEAARRLAGKAHRALHGGSLPPEHVRLSATATVRERLTQADKTGDWGPLSADEQKAVRGVLDLIDRIDRAAAAAERENHDER
jgi:hypothetical protein